MARKKKPRGLSKDDVEIWHKVTETALPLGKAFSPDLTDPMVDVTIPTLPSKQTPLVIEPFNVGQKTAKPKQAPSFANRPAEVSPNMDRRNFQRLLKGQKDIDGTLDLHGMTADQAKQALRVYLTQAAGMGKRLILVITGKGKTGHRDEFGRMRRGILKESLPDWLRMAPLSSLVLQVTSAHGKHGGGGAYYVYLRRRR